MTGGVYILKYKGVHGLEYRVTYASHIESIYGPNYNDDTMSWECNSVEVHKIFKNALRFENYNQALAVASKIAASYDYLEDGVMTISSFENVKLF